MNEKKTAAARFYDGFKKIVKDRIGITSLQDQIITINAQLAILQSMVNGEDIHKRSQERWLNSEPEKGLTWNKEIQGDQFVMKLQRHAAPGKQTRMLEIGPGYGRLLKSLLKLNVDFQKYVGLDIAEKNVDFLRSAYGNERIEFVRGDVENHSFAEKFDVIFSSLTFKHLYPSFAAALKNLSRCLAPGGIILFDLIEGSLREFEKDMVTYVHRYTKESVAEILAQVPLELVAFDTVEHEPGFVRLLVVARQGPGRA